MSLPTPDLDDRSFEQLVAEARSIIARSCPDWTDLGPNDPGAALVEVFAHLTEVMLYRLNRVPDKVFRQFLDLLGVEMRPPSAASVTLRLSREDTEAFREVPRGTRVTTEPLPDVDDPPVFATSRRALFEPGQAEVLVTAHAADIVEGELLGVGTGLGGLVLRVGAPPVIARTGDELDLVIGVEESGVEEVDAGGSALKWEGKDYRIWREVESFAEAGDDGRVYLADRRSGTIAFAPAVEGLGDDGGAARPRPIADVPERGREIRAWYRRGGGASGNVPAGSLTVMKDPVAGVEVTNPEAATGGRDAETLENAVLRGPLEFRAQDRAVTRRDYEHVCVRSSGAVARARAVAQPALWAFGAPGTIEIFLVPALSEAEREEGHVSAELLRSRETDDALSRVRDALEQRRTLGATCQVGWTRYKSVEVRARVAVSRAEDPRAVRERVLRRLHRAIAPLPTSLDRDGWGFGETIHASNVFQIILSEPGVSFVDQVRLVVDEAPDSEVRALEADPFQPARWYAGSGPLLFQSEDDGAGWEVLERFEGETVRLVHADAEVAGALAVVTVADAAPEPEPPAEGDEDGPPPEPEEPEWSVHVSSDCGQRWERAARFRFRVRDLAWHERDRAALLFLATDNGLYELSLAPGSAPVQVLVDVDRLDLGFHAVAVHQRMRGGTTVAVAARGEGGVLLSVEGGRRGTFEPIGLDGQDVRVLAVQRTAGLAYLWAGAYALGDREGTGCQRWELRGTTESPSGWQAVSEGWRGGSCTALEFDGEAVRAATHHAGVLDLVSERDGERWRAPSIDCGLAMRDVGRFHPVYALALRRRDEKVVAMAGGPEGVRRRADEGSWTDGSRREFLERVTLPATWLFCSGEHRIDVVSTSDAE